MPSDILHDTFPPRWNVGDSWVVSVVNEVQVMADLAPRFAERVFRYRVDRMPTEKDPYYRVEARPDNPEESEVFFLYFREDGFSLARVTRPGEGDLESEIIDNGMYPFVDYDRRLPIIADMAAYHPPERADNILQFDAAGKRVTQRVRLAGDTLHLELEQQEPGATLIVEMKWRKGDPWWREIECLAIGPGNRKLSRKDQVVASGFMMSRSAAPKSD